MKRIIILIMIFTLAAVSCSNNNTEIPEKTETPLNIEESNDRGLVEAYIKAIQKLINDDTALNHGTSFYAVEIDTLKGINQEEVAKIQSFIESKGKDFRDASMDELKQAGEFDEETLSLKRSILLRIDEIKRYTDSDFIFTASKFRSGLGAIGMTFEFTKTEDGWEFSKTSGFWIS